MIKELQKIANYLDSYGYIKEANQIDKILSLNVKLASSNLNNYNTNVANAFLVMDVGLSIKNKDISKKVASISSNLIKEAIFKNIWDKAKKVLNTPLTLQGKEEQISKNIKNKIINFHAKINGYVHNWNQANAENILQEVSKEVNSLKLELLNVNANVKTNSWLFVMTSAIAEGLHKWQENADKFSSIKSSLAGLENILIKLWSYVNSQAFKKNNSSFSNDTSYEANPRSRGKDSEDRNASIPENSLNSIYSNVKNADKFIMLALRKNKAYVVSVFKDAASVLVAFSTNDIKVRWNSLPNDILSHLWRRSKALYENARQTSYKDLSHLKDKSPDSLQRMNQEIVEFDNKFG